MIVFVLVFFFVMTSWAQVGQLFLPTSPVLPCIWVEERGDESTYQSVHIHPVLSLGGLYGCWVCNMKQVLLLGHQ